MGPLYTSVTAMWRYIQFGLVSDAELEMKASRTIHFASLNVIEQA